MSLDRMGAWLETGFALYVAIVMVIAFVQTCIIGTRYFVQAVINCSRGRRVRDFLFDRVDLNELPAALAEHLERFTPDMQALGLQLIGDYRLLRAPRPLYARYFLAPDGRTFGEIFASSGKFRSYNFFSVRDDGTYVETIALAQAGQNGDQLQIWCHPDLSVKELYAQHQAYLGDRGRNTNRRPFRMTADDLETAAQFGRRLAGVSGFVLGKRIEPPNL